MKCFRCQEQGHMARDCKVKEVVKCFNCYKFGHKASDCWKNKIHDTNVQQKHKNNMSNLCLPTSNEKEGSVKYMKGEFLGIQIKA